MKSMYIILLGGKPLAKLSKDGKIEVLQTDDEEVIKKVCESMSEIFEDIGYVKVVGNSYLNKNDLEQIEKDFSYSKYDIKLPSEGKTVFNMSDKDKRNSDNS